MSVIGRALGRAPPATNVTHAAISVRRVAPSFARMCSMCALTVFGGARLRSAPSQGRERSGTIARCGSRNTPEQGAHLHPISLVRGDPDPASRGSCPHRRRRTGRPVPGRAAPVGRRLRGPPLRAPTRVHAHPHGVARPVPRGRLARELQGGHDRLGERRGHLRADRARDKDGVPPFRRRGPAGPAPRVDARVHRAEDNRAVAQRAHRRTRYRDGGAHRRRGVRRASPLDGGTGRHPRRLHRHPVAPARPPAAGR